MGSTTSSTFPTLTSFSFGKGCKLDREAAFSGCTSLKEITIPRWITDIPDSCFRECTNLSEIIVPNTVEDIGAAAFADTAWYDSQGNGPVYVAGRVLYKYKGSIPQNTALVIPEGVVSISDSAVGDALDVLIDIEGLISVLFPKSLQKVGRYAFANCTGLTEISIPTDCYVDSAAFAGCSGLVNAEVSAYFLSKAVFDSCKSLQNVWLRSSVETIAAGTSPPFLGCNSDCVLYCEPPSPPDGWQGDWDVYAYQELDGATVKSRLKKVWGQKTRPW